MVRSQDNNYATDLESNQIRLKQEDRGLSGKVFFQQKWKQITSVNILRGYLYLLTEFGIDYCRYIENKANGKKRKKLSQKLHKKEIIMVYMFHDSQWVMI